LHTGDPGNPSIEVHRDIGNHETHVIRVGKNCLPALAHGFPATEQTPARMHTFCPLCLDPYSGHLADIQALKGTIKTFIGTFDPLNSFFLGCHSCLLTRGDCPVPPACGISHLPLFVKGTSMERGVGTTARTCGWSEAWIALQASATQR